MGLRNRVQAYILTLYIGLYIDSLYIDIYILTYWLIYWWFGVIVCMRLIACVLGMWVFMFSALAHVRTHTVDVYA